MTLSTEHGISLFLLVTFLLILFFLFLIYILRFIYLKIKRHSNPKLPLYLSRRKSQARGVQGRRKERKEWWRDMEGMQKMYEINEQDKKGGRELEVDAQGRDLNGEMWERGVEYWDEDEDQKREEGLGREIGVEIEMRVVERDHRQNLPARASRWLYGVEMEPNRGVGREEDGAREGKGWREIPIKG